LNNIPAGVDEKLAVFELVDQFGYRPGGIGLGVVPTVEELDEYPLSPAVVLDVGRRDAARPVVAEAEPADLALDVGDVLCRRLSRMHAVLDGVLFRGQAESVVTHWVQDVMACHAGVAADDVRGGVTLGVTDVQARSRRIWEHVQHVLAGPVNEFRIAGIWLVEGLIGLPVVLPFLLDSGEIIPSHGHSSSIPDICQFRYFDTPPRSVPPKNSPYHKRRAGRACPRRQPDKAGGPVGPRETPHQSVLALPGSNGWLNRRRIRRRHRTWRRRSRRAFPAGPSRGLARRRNHRPAS